MTQELQSFVTVFKSGEIVFQEGDEGSEMYFIQSGMVRIEKTIDGRSEPLALLEKGDFFGEMAIIDSVPRSASAVAVEETQLLKIDASNFAKVLSGNVEIVIRIMRKYAARLRDANAKLEALVLDRREMDRGIQDILQSVRKCPEDTPSPPLAHLEPLSGSGSFVVNLQAVTIGRKDPVTEIVPDIDLTDLDEGRSVSRRHARLIKEKSGFVLIEEIGASNGTLVDGERLEPGKARTLEAGSVIQFGNVELKFVPMR